MTRQPVREGIHAVRRHRAVASLVDHYASLRQLRHRDLALLAGANVLDVMSVSIVVPLLPAYAAEAGVGPVMLGVIFAAPPATRAVLSPVTGHLADRFDRHRLIWLGTVLGALSVVGLGFVRDPLLFVMLRGLDGAAYAMKGPATSAYIGSRVATNERASAIGAYRTAGMLGLAIGPGIGGGIAVLGGLAAPFVVLGAGSFAAGVTLWAYLRPVDRPAAAESDNQPGRPLNVETFRRLAAWPVAVLVVSALLSQLGTGAMYPTLAPLLARTVDAGPGYTGLAWSAFGLSMFLFTPVGGTLADRRGRKPFVVGGKLAWCLVSVGLVLAVVPVLPPALLFLGGVASALAGPALGALHYETAPAGFEATTLGVYSTAAAAGMALGPIVGGVVTASFGVEALYVGIGLVWTVDAGLLWLGVRETAGAAVS